MIPDEGRSASRSARDGGEGDDGLHGRLDRSVKTHPQRRRRRRIIQVGLGIAVAVGIGVPTGLLVGGSSPPPRRLSTPGHEPRPAPPQPGGRGAGGSSTTPTVGANARPTALAAAALDSFVADETAAYRRQYGAGPDSAAARLASVHSAPVPDGARLVALAAFAFAGDRHPVQLLAYGAGGWTTTSSLAPPDWPPTEPNFGLPLVSAPVQVAYLTDGGHPDFLVLLQAGDNTPGFVVAEQAGQWRYVPFNGPYPPDNVLGRNPSFVDGRLISQYNDCAPDCAGGHTYQLNWTYRPDRGDFWAPDPPGWTPPEGSENYQPPSPG